VFLSGRSIVRSSDRNRTGDVPSAGDEAFRDRAKGAVLELRDLDGPSSLRQIDRQLLQVEPIAVKMEHRPGKGRDVAVMPALRWTEIVLIVTFGGASPRRANALAMTR
jgi:hypothetical protein